MADLHRRLRQFVAAQLRRRGNRMPLPELHAAALAAFGRDPSFVAAFLLVASGRDGRLGWRSCASPWPKR